MCEDAYKMNFSINRIEPTVAFTLSGTGSIYSYYSSTNSCSNNERMIALVTGSYISNTGGFHFYLRNGNGTCTNGHASTGCSTWSHKLPEKPVNNLVIPLNANNPSNMQICDYNIVTVYQNGTMESPLLQSAYKYGQLRFYKITKDVNVYNYGHNSGHQSTSTGTIFN